MKIKINKILIGYLLILSGISYAANENTFTGSSSRPNKIINNSAGRLTLSTEYNSISQDFRQKFIIIHYTAINKESSIRALVEKDVSSHFLISDQYGDPVYYLVDEDKRAWHAGLSSWKTRTNLNDSSLGIEIMQVIDYLKELSQETNITLISHNTYLIDYPNYDRVVEVEKEGTFTKYIYE